jgi:hypothetical protein
MHFFSRADAEALARELSDIVPEKDLRRLRACL